MGFVPRHLLERRGGAQCAGKLPSLTVLSRAQKLNHIFSMKHFTVCYEKLNGRVEGPLTSNPGPWRVPLKSVNVTRWVVFTRQRPLYMLCVPQRILSVCPCQ